jgi:BirA family transcriptional regulator, biotin operon repressor / biotin---[acetyl-CoA-carboxylase] ligase
VSVRSEIVNLLSAMKLHAGTEIAQALGSDWPALERELEVLRCLGLMISQFADGRYRLEIPVCPLDVRKIHDYLRPHDCALARRLYLFDEVDSTSSQLVREIARLHTHVPAACVAEAQTAGRGRTGRSWFATPYSNIMLSAAWPLQGGRVPITGLSLAGGVALVRALHDCGVREIGLKWPNDLLWQQRKLAGLLVEVRHQAGHAPLIVLGVGINVRLAERDARLIEQPWAELATILREGVDRNWLVATVLKRLEEMFVTFERSGLAAFRNEWEQLHIHQGQYVRLLQGRTESLGRVIGIAADGALQIETDDGRRVVFHYGDVSLRPCA